MKPIIRCLGSCFVEGAARYFIAAVLVYACLAMSSLSADAIEIPPELTTPNYRTCAVTGIGYDANWERGDPSNVLKVDDAYYVWYTRFTPGTSIFSGTVYYASSTDGYHWTELGQAVDKGASGQWDSYGAITPYVAHIDDTYYMYYTGSAIEDVGPARPEMRHIGVAVADNPNGPWTKTSQRALSPGEEGAWDSLLVDDAHVIVRDGQYWLYYKGGAPGVTAETTKWGLALADSPTGPFTKYPTNPVLDSGHTVCVWPHREGVAALVDNAGPERHTVQYSVNGVDFERAAEISWVDVGCGPYDPDAFTDTDYGDGITWGITGRFVDGHNHLLRFEVDCAVGSNPPSPDPRIAVEPFAMDSGTGYVPGAPLVGQGPPSTGFTGTWRQTVGGDQPFQTETTGLDHAAADYESGGSVQISPAADYTGNNIVQRDLGSFTPNDTYYMSGMLSVDQDGSAYAENGQQALMTWFSGVGYFNLGVRGHEGAGQVVLRLIDGSNPDYTPITIREGYDANEVLYFLAKVEVDADGANDRVSVILNPTDLSSEQQAWATSEVAPVVIDDHDTFNNASPISALELSVNNMPGATITFDEILFGTTFASVTGEEAAALPGDLNGDGFVGGDDLDIVRSHWGQDVTAGDVGQGDPSGDGFVGGDDLDLIRSHWGQGTPSPSAVPEPITMTMLVAAALFGMGFAFGRRLRER